MTRLAILGSTGSIGTSALSVVDTHADRLEVAALAAANNVDAFVDQVVRYRPRAISMATREALDAAVAALGARGAAVPPVAVWGVEGLVTLSELDDVDVVLCATSGTAGLDATLAALKRGRTVALANKEVLVLAGGLMIEAARQSGGSILPVDSEHNAIHQCLHARRPDEVRRLVLTASGGPFRTWSAEDIGRARPEDALRHPTWRMGQKITVDSATLMNKGLEVIEARWLFDVDASRIDVVIHPQSIVHSMVELIDGSVIAQMGVTDMRLPIQYAFSYPERWPAPVAPLDLGTAMTFEFHPPDRDRFPCLGLAYRALEAGGAMPAVLNAANEVAVAAFLDGRLPFPGIAAVIESALDTWAREPRASGDSLKDIRTADAWARAHASAQIPAFQ
ncbi:MAG TPA: 1-deoxy-D-xylulose-5-phosphate reductoisomerase [Vicinamibacterales bacterium]|nr:1-deoxy-D-xylulose-5-phosphate reductoisomerase [Vicinamibacterales bacterium]